MFGVFLCVWMAVCVSLVNVFVLCCVCYDCLCASLVIHNALLSGVFCCVLLYSCVRFCLTSVVVCLVCDLFV